jgi:hypothetical protein
MDSYAVFPDKPITDAGPGFRRFLRKKIAPFQEACR